MRVSDIAHLTHVLPPHINNQSRKAVVLGSKSVFDVNRVKTTAKCGCGIQKSKCIMVDRNKSPVALIPKGKD